MRLESCSAMVYSHARMLESLQYSVPKRSVSASSFEARVTVSLEYLRATVLEAETWDESWQTRWWQLKPEL